MEENKEIDGYVPADVEGDEFADFLPLVDGPDTDLYDEPSALNIEMSDAQKAELAAQKANNDSGLPDEDAASADEQSQLQNIDDINKLEGDGQGDGDEDEIDVILQLLEARGIKDGLVKMENENGEVEDVPFGELTAEEQFNILNSSVSDVSLEDHEKETINFLRENNVTFEQAVEYYIKKAVDEALSDATVEKSIQEFSDEEIYKLDLQSKFKNFTEEEIDLELAKQQEHPDLFKKKVDALREEYLQLEKDQATQKENDTKQAEELEFKKITQSLVNVAREVEDIGGLDIEVEDKREVLGFILNKDVNGATELGKLLDDPKSLFEIAWFAKKGREAFDTLHDYYKKEISEASRKGYEKGKTEASAEIKKPAVKSNLKVAVKTTQTNSQPKQPAQPSYMKVEELYDDLLPNHN